MISEKWHLEPFDYLARGELAEKNEGGVLSFLCTTLNGRHARFSITSHKDGLIRFRMGMGMEGSHSDNSVIEQFPEKMGLSIVGEAANLISCEAGDCLIEISLNPWKLKVVNREGTVLIQEEVDDKDAVGKRRVPPMGFSLNSAGDIIGCNACFSLPQDEHFFGLGEKFNALDKRGQSIHIRNCDSLGIRNDDSYKNVPFFISSRGYGFFLNHYCESVFSIGNLSNCSWNLHVQDPCLDFVLIPGNSMSSILSKYTLLSGRSPMPPYWSFGTWLSTGFTDTSQKSVLELARLTRDKKIPADVIHIDCYWLQPSMWCDLEWDLENFPDPAGMLAELHEKGFKTCLWINPYVSVLSPLFKEGDRHGFFLKKSDGSTYVKDMWHGLQPECSIVDFTNKDAAHWFREKLESLLDAGVACFKTDFGEDIPEDTFFSNGLTGEKMRNRYSILYNRTVFETVRDKRGEGLVWGRSGFAGSQKYPVCWSGDPACSFPAMAAVLRGGLSYGLSGVPFWSHDVGGFYGTPNEELYIRWTQFGMFSSHIRCHGTTGREPWRYGPESELIFLKYARLRYSLIPYIHTVAATCCETGEPFIRPLVFHWSKDPTLYSMDDQYMFGPDMLVAPLFSYEKKRPIYLPEGGWFDFHNHQRFQGPAWIVFLAPLDVLPLFVREGAIIPRLMGEASSNLPEKWKGSLYFEQYGKTDRSEVYIFLPDQKWESLPVITLQDTGTLITIQPERGGESHAGS